MWYRSINHDPRSRSCHHSRSRPICVTWSSHHSHPNLNLTDDLSSECHYYVHHVCLCHHHGWCRCDVCPAFGGVSHPSVTPDPSTLVHWFHYQPCSSCRYTFDVLGWVIVWDTWWSRCLFGLGGTVYCLSWWMSPWSTSICTPTLKNEKTTNMECGNVNMNR